MFLYRYHDDLPQLENQYWASAAQWSVYMDAVTSTMRAMWLRGDLLSWDGFDEVVLLASQHGWSDPLVCLVQNQIEFVDAVRVDDRSATSLCGALQVALDEGVAQPGLADHDLERLPDLFAFCERGGFDVVEG